jgi:hypothetical protein
MSETIKLKKGLNIKLAGKPPIPFWIRFPSADHYAIKPTDFPGLLQG